MDRKERVKKLIKVAEAQLGKPFQYGALASKNVNDVPELFDCSSFTKFIFSNIGFNNFPRSSIEQAFYQGKEILSIGKAWPGDLIFFEGTRGHYIHNLLSKRKIYIGHVALCIGKREIIYCTNGEHITGVVKQKLYNLPHYPKWPNNIVMIKRYF